MTDDNMGTYVDCRITLSNNYADSQTESQMTVDLYKTNGSSPPCISTVDAPPTAATLPNPLETLAVALEDPAIKEAIQRGARKAQVKKYAAVTKNGRDKVCEHISDFVQATYVALLESHAEAFAALTPEERPRFVEQLAKRTARHEVYPMKREVPLAEPFDSDEVGSEGPRSFACDDISLNGRRSHPNWISAHAFELELIDRIDLHRAKTPPEEQPESKYERRCRLVGLQTADWMLDYENHRYESAKTPAERVRYHRLRKKLVEM